MGQSFPQGEVRTISNEGSRGRF